MSGIYLKDNHHNKRTLEELKTTLSDFIPDKLPTEPIISTGKGFRLNFPNISDANSYFNAEVIRNLRQAKYEPELSHETAKKREVIIPDISYDTYIKDDHLLISHLNEDNSDFNIIHIIKFISRHSNKRFIRVFLDSNESQLRLINANRIKLC